MFTPATANGYSHMDLSPSRFQRRFWKDFCITGKKREVGFIGMTFKIRRKGKHPAERTNQVVAKPTNQEVMQSDQIKSAA